MTQTARTWEIDKKTKLIMFKKNQQQYDIDSESVDRDGSNTRGPAISLSRVRRRENYYRGGSEYFERTRLRKREFAGCAKDDSSRASNSSEFELLCIARSRPISAGHLLRCQWRARHSAGEHTGVYASTRVEYEKCNCASIPGCGHLLAGTSALKQ